MDVMGAIEKRRSVRKYKPDEIPEDVLDKLLNAMRLAPSGKNRQPWKFTVVRDKTTKAKLADACNGQKWIAEAPVVIVACGSEKEAAVRYYRDGQAIIGVGWDIEAEMEDGSIEYESCLPMDLAIALDHLTLAAVEEGLGTCWIGALNEHQVKELLSVPDDVRAALVMPIGYPVSWPEPRPRKPIEEIVCYEKYG
jgi:nitroreductase